MIQNYRQLIEQQSIHTSPEILFLHQQRLSFDYLILVLKQVQKSADMSINELKQGIMKTEKKVIQNLSFLNYELNQCLKSLSISQTQQENVESKQVEKDLQRNQKQHEYQSQNLSRRVIYQQYVTSYFGNKIKGLKFFEKPNQKNVDKKFIENKQTVKQEVKFAQPQQKESLKQNNQQNIFVPGAQTLKADEFYCGQCKLIIANYRQFSSHIRKHDYIIDQESSHILIRKKGIRTAQPLNVWTNKNKKQRFTCACNSQSNYSKQQFVKHVFKWHKGITPKI